MKGCWCNGWVILLEQNVVKIEDGTFVLHLGSKEIVFIMYCPFCGNRLKEISDEKSMHDFIWDSYHSSHDSVAQD